jgi:hypothetical protein
MFYAIDVRYTKLFLGNRFNFVQRSLNSRASPLLARDVRRMYLI